MSDSESIKVHLGGSRTVMPDYVNVDKYLAFRDEVTQDDALDFMRKQGPGTVEHVVTKHMIEHMSKVRADVLVGECFRALKSKCEIIIECPDLDEAVRLYLEDPGFITTIFGLQRHGGDYHLWGYTKKTLRELLEKHGFEIVEECTGANYQRSKEHCLRIVGRKP